MDLAPNSVAPMRHQQRQRQRSGCNLPRLVVLPAVSMGVLLLFMSLTTNVTLFNGTKRNGTSLSIAVLGERGQRFQRQKPKPSGQQQQQPKQKQMQQRRWLNVANPSSTGATCALTSETFRFVLDPATNQYVAYVETSSSTTSSTNQDGATNNQDSIKRLNGIVRWNQTTASLDSNDSNNTLATTATAAVHTPAFIQVRACSCLTRLASREDFCPAHFNTCAVHAIDDPVSCYTRLPSDMIVRVAWAISMVSMLLLSYTWIFTEYGATARRFIRRTFHYRNVWSTPEERQSSEQEAIRQLEHLLRHEPRRAAYMFRHHMLRERDRQRRQQVLLETRWYQWTILSVRRQQHLPSPETVVTRGVDETTSQGAATHSASGLDSLRAGMDLRPSLRLKVKVYRSKDACYGGGEGSMDGAIGICKGGTVAFAAAAAAATASPGTSATNAHAHSWGLPMVLLQLNNNTNALNHDMDHATFDVMDDETERGIRCAICLTRLRDGDIIGDITCCHSMHKDCLKDWLPRKNRCPLCQTTGIALLENDPSSMDGQHTVGEPQQTSEQSTISPTATTDSSSEIPPTTGST